MEHHEETLISFISTITSLFEKYNADGNGLVITGETGKFDETGQENKENQIFKIYNISGNDKLKSSDGQKKFIYDLIQP